MKILVLSDSHGRVDLFSRAVELCGECDALLFLGDGCGDVRCAKLPDDKCFVVRGNGEDNFLWTNKGVPRELLLDFDGVKVLMLHGHKPYDVKYGEGIHRMVAYAAEKDADILLFGHTHGKYNKTFTEGTVICGKPLSKNIIAFNPGSVGEAKYEAGSFGVLTIRDGVPLLSHGEIDR
ncbi:MAG: metallophosphoesterase family protein [Clostridia bacterium]|nr:metallophosphoesterase family protein [Clostridia bacterium]